MVRRWLLWVLRDDLTTETRLLELETEWRELVTKLSAAVAREAKAKKRAVSKALDGETHTPTPATPPTDRKSLLRQRVAAARGLRVVGATLPEVTNESGSQDG